MTKEPLESMASDEPIPGGPDPAGGARDEPPEPNGSPPWWRSPLIQAAFMALAADLVVLLLKLGTFAASSSPSVYADAWHTASDMLISMTVILSLIVEHRMGERGSPVENFTAMGVGLFIVANGLYVLMRPGRSGSYTPVELYVGLGGTLLTILAITALARFKLRIARRYGSLSFEAEGHHSLSDMWTSVGVFLTLVLALAGVEVERLTSGVIGLLIVRIGLLLLGRSTEGLERKIADRPDLFQATRLGASARAVARWSKRIKGGLRAMEDLSRSHAWTLVGLAALGYASMGFYRVTPGQAAVHVCFGKLQGGVKGPGLHVHPPPPFCRRMVVDTARERRLTLGLPVVEPGAEAREPAAYMWDASGLPSGTAKARDSLHVTGDTYVVDLQVVVGYSIDDLEVYLLAAEDPVALLRGMLQALVSEQVAGQSLESLLTRGRAELEDALLVRAREVARGLGIRVSSVQVLSVHPPLSVVPVYRSVASAREARQEKVERARGYSNDLIPRSRGEAHKITTSAQLYRVTRVDEAQGRAEAFEARVDALARERRLHSFRLEQDAMASALGKAARVWLMPPGYKGKRLFVPDTRGGSGPAPKEAWITMPPEPKRTPWGDPYPEDESYEEDTPDEPPEPYEQ